MHRRVAPLVSGTITVLVFAAVLLMPTFDGLTEDGAESREGRKLAAAPVWPEDWQQLDGYPDAFEAWFADRFAGRQDLLDAYRRLMFGLGSSPTDQVVLGDDGWLFYTEAGIMADYRGESEPSRDELERWKAVLLERSAWVAERGARFAFAVAPNKVTIYPDRLRDSEENDTAQPTRLDRLVEHLQQDPVFELIDLRGPLRAAARDRQVYLRTDSHWNHHGAFVGYRALVEGLRARGVAIEPLSLDQLRVDEVELPGDLARLLGVPGIEPERRVRLPCQKELPARRIATPEPIAELSRRAGAWEDPIVYECEAGEGTLLMFRDSFAWPMIPWLAQHFRYSVFISRFPAEFELFGAFFETLKPTLVVEMRVERNMAWTPKRRPQR
jgi:hypothetical protein